jgi:hypothetical protein
MAGSSECIFLTVKKKMSLPIAFWDNRQPESEPEYEVREVIQPVLRAPKTRFRPYLLAPCYQRERSEAVAVILSRRALGALAARQICAALQYSTATF